MTRRQRIALCEIAAVLALPVALLLGLAALSRLLYPWPEPVPGVRLEPLRPPLPPEQIRPDNAFYYLRQLTEIRRRGATTSVLEELDEFRYIGWEAGRFPACVQCLIETEPNLKLFEQAAAAPTAQAAVTHWGHWEPCFSEATQTMDLLAFDAERAAAENRWDDAAKDFRLVLRNAAYLTHGGYFRWRNGIASAAVSLRRLAIEGNPPAPWLREMIRLAQETDANLDPWLEGLRHRRLVHLECPDLLLSHLERLPYTLDRGFDPGWEERSWKPATPMDGTLAVAYRPLAWLFGSSPERSRRHVDAVLSRYMYVVATDERPYAPFKWLDKPEWNTWQFWLWGLNDPVARAIVLSMELPDLGPSLPSQKEDRLESVARFRAATLTCALRLYQAEHEGKLPEALAALAPGYLPRLPDDPFAPGGTPFGYRSNPDGTVVLWSRGPDRIDHGGRYNFGLPRTPGAEENRKECDLLFASDDFPKLRAYGIEQARQRAAAEAACKAQAGFQGLMFMPFGKP